MAVLEIPDQQRIETDVATIRSYLAERGVWFDQWRADVELAADATQQDVLDAYAGSLQPYMQSNGYKTADVIRIKPGIEGLDAVRHKFLKEHRHSEDEVRFFVEGKGYFWFNLEQENQPVFALLCEPGDLISVPARTAHWFDMGADPDVTAIRVFIDTSGWIPEYTDSGVEQVYNKPFDQKIP